MASGVIKNFDELATSSLREDALNILEAGYLAISTKKVIEEKVRIEGEHFIVGDTDIRLGDYDRILFVGVGKCAADAAEVFENLLGDYMSDGIVIDVRGTTLKKIKSHIGTHPLPSKNNVVITQSVMELLKRATKRDLIIAVISGGGSALLCLPHDIKCDMVLSVTKELMQKGANIKEINIVRKHFSLIQGGHFARIAYPAKIVSLIFSDVPGDDISVVASGPTVFDVTTKEDAKNILEKYNISVSCHLPLCEILETPKEKKYFDEVENILMLTNENALISMKKKAQSLGYDAIIADRELQGKASLAGKFISSQARRKSCILYGGETTVTIKDVNGKGRGGRNQEFVLGALRYLKEDTVIVAAASDGYDNIDVAGALGDRALLEKAQKGGFDIEEILNLNNSYEFFQKLGGHIKTGKTGSNVSDLYFTLTG